MRQGIHKLGLRVVSAAFILAAAVAPLGMLAQTPDTKPAAAATAAPAEPDRGGIEEIIVTSQKREQSIQDVPISMTAFTEELEQGTIRDIRDLNGYSANVRIDSNPDRAGGSSITIRGISPTRTDDNSLDSPIGVMIDGIYLGSLSGQILENFDLERVEILRGPQGTLYGRNTIGGVLHVIRTKPTGEWGARIQYTTGQYNQQEFRGVMNMPLIEEKLAAKLFFTTIQRDGFWENEFLHVTQPQRDYKNFGATIKANPTEWFEALLTIEKFDDNSDGGANTFNWNLKAGVAKAPPVGSVEPNYSGGFLGCTGALAFLGPQLAQQVPCRTSLSRPKTTNANSTNPANTETKAYTLNMTAELSDTMKIVSVTGFRDMVENRFLDFDGSSGDFITIDRDNKFQQFSQEVRLEGSWEGGIGRIDYVVGGFYWWNQFDQHWNTGGSFWSFVGGLSGYDLATNQWSPFFLANPVSNQSILNGLGFTPASGCLAPRTTAPLQAVFGQVQCDAGAGNVAYGPKLVQRLFEDQTTRSAAGFAHVDWEFIDGVTATLGIRYTTEKKHFLGAQSYLAPLSRGSVDTFPSVANLRNKWNDVAPKFGLSWEPTEDIMIYTTYSEGWHSGGFFGVNQNVSDFTRDQYDPETAQSIEGGIKTRFLDNRLQVNAAFFWNKFKNKQEQSVQFDASTQTVATVFDNVGSAIYQGIEIEIQASPIEGLNLFGTFGWLDPRYTKFSTDINPNDSCTGLPICIVDAKFLRPRNAPKYTAGLGGSFTQPIGPGAATISTKYSYVGEVEGSLLNISFNRVHPRHDLQASLAYNLEFENYSIGIEAFGRNLTNGQIEFPAVIAPLFAASTITPGRTWGLQLTASF